MSLTQKIKSYYRTELNPSMVKVFCILAIICVLSIGVIFGFQFFKKEESIPKIIHYVWVGPNPMPNDFKKVLASWKKYAPDYQIMRWGNKTCDIEGNTFAKLAYQEKNYAFVSDYCRMKALYEFGGVYLDTDHEIKENAFSVLSGTNLLFSYDWSGCLSASFFAASKNHPLIKNTLDIYMGLTFVDPNKSSPSILTGEYKKLFSRKLDGTYYHSNELTLLPGNFTMIDFGGSENVAVHHYDGSWSNHKNGYWYNERKKQFLNELALPICLKNQNKQHIIRKYQFGSAYIYETKQPVRILWQTKKWLLLWKNGLKLLNYQDNCYKN